MLRMNGIWQNYICPGC